MALMDGNFFSLLPKGKGDNIIVYHVKYSILKSKVSKFFPVNWYSSKLLNRKKIEFLKKKIYHDMNFFSKINVQFTGKHFISPRVFLLNSKKTDKRFLELVKSKKLF